MTRPALMRSVFLTTLIAAWGSYLPGAQTAKHFGPGAAPPVALKIRFEGLVAYAPAKTGDALWALLPNADYNPQNGPLEADLPRCAIQEYPDYTNDYPPHVIALRIQNAQVALNGGTGVARTFIIPLSGTDLRFDTGTKLPTPINAPPLLANQDALVTARGGKPQDYAALDQVDPVYVDENKPFDFAKNVFLGARVKIDFGVRVDAKPLDCLGGVYYGFRAPQDVNDCQYQQKLWLAETVIVSQPYKKPVTITLLPSSDYLTITPDGTGNDLTVDVLNVTPESIADPYFDHCAQIHQHAPSFRWYYRLLYKPTKPYCSDHFIPCEAPGGSHGGSKCPQKGLVVP